MATSLNGVISTIKSLGRELSDKKITFLAASLVCYAFMSVIPLILLALATATAIGGQDLATTIIQNLGRTLPEEGTEIVRTILSTAEGTTGATVVGVLVPLWGALKIFRGLDIAFSWVYGESGGSLAEQIEHGLVALVTVLLGILITFAIGAVIALVPSDVTIGGFSFLGTIGTIVSILGLSLTLLPLYYVLPSRRMRVRQALPGAAFTAVGWTLLQTAFRFYASYARNYAAYGVIGGVLLVITVLYFASIVLLFGAVLNAVLAGHTGRTKPVSEAEDDQSLADHVRTEEQS